MKITNHLLLLIIGSALFFACEKKIDVELKEKDKHIVIEALLKEGTTDFTVKVSKTSAYFSNVPPSDIDDATITLTDEFGLSQSIPSIGNGQYRSSVVSHSARNYTLTAIVEGVSYVASSYMNEKLNLSALSTEFVEETTFQEAHHTVTYEFTDPVNTKNFYQIRHYREGGIQQEVEDLIVLSDDNADGNVYSMIINDNTFQTGENVMVELMHIDEITHDYYYSLLEIVNGGNGAGVAAPGNPITNWSNGALGNFAAYSSDSLSIVIP